MIPASAGSNAVSSETREAGSGLPTSHYSHNSSKQNDSNSPDNPQDLRRFNAPLERERKAILSAIPRNHPARFLMIGMALNSQDMAGAAKAYDNLHAEFMEYYRVRNRRPPTAEQLEYERYGSPHQRKGSHRHG
jgi:hypothetical protein